MCTCRHHERRLRIRRCWERASVLTKAIDAAEARSRNIAVISDSLDIKTQKDSLPEGKFKELAKLHEFARNHSVTNTRLRHIRFLSTFRNAESAFVNEDMSALIRKFDADASIQEPLCGRLGPCSSTCPVSDYFIVLPSPSTLKPSQTMFLVLSYVSCLLSPSPTLCGFASP